MSASPQAKGFPDKPKSTGYAPRAYGYALDYNDQRPFFRLVDVEKMRRDQKVQFGLRILRAPLYGLKWTVKAKSEPVRQFVDAQFTKIWKTCLQRLSTGVFSYGHFPGEWTYRTLKDGTVKFRELIQFHPFDCDPLVSRENRLVGLELRGVKYVHAVRMGQPSYCWAVHDSEYNSFRGRSRMLNAWTPWMEKVGRHGALDIRRLWFFKNAFRGDRLRHPDGDSLTAEGVRVNNQDYAREIVEKMETGANLALPNTKSNGTDYDWLIEDAKVLGSVEDMREYPKDLDKEILEGLGIPIEVVQASGESGSGYAGRSIPARVYYVSLDETVTALVHNCIDPQCLRPMARHNFGAEAEYEIECESLLPPEQPGQGTEDPRPVAPDDRRPAPQPQPIAFSHAAEEARRKYPLGGWARTANGELIRVTSR